MNSTDVANSTDICTYKDDPYQAAKLLNFYLTAAITAFGLISNTLVIVVIQRMSKPTSTDMYFGLLALSDNLLIFSVLLFCFRYAYRFIFPVEHINWVTSGVVSMIGIMMKNFSQCLNTYTIVLLNVDRYIQVKFLARAKKWCTPRRAVINFIFAAFGAAIFCVPKIIEFSPKLRTPVDFVKPCTGFFKSGQGLALSETYIILYRWIAYILVLYAVPLTTLTVTNITLISTLYQRRKWLTSLKPGVREPHTADIKDQSLQKKEIGAIVSLVSVTLIFMLCQVPDVVLQFIWKLAPKLGPTAAMFAYDIVLINSSINFIVYAISSSAFRRKLRKVFQRKKDSGSSSYSP